MEGFFFTLSDGYNLYQETNEPQRSYWWPISSCRMNIWMLMQLGQEILHELPKVPQISVCSAVTKSSCFCIWFLSFFPSTSVTLKLYLFLKISFIYSWETHTERQRPGQRRRQRQKQAPCGEPDAGLNPRTPGSQPKPKADAQPLSHPDTPYFNFLNKRKQGKIGVLKVYFLLIWILSFESIVYQWCGFQG